MGIIIERINNMIIITIPIRIRSFFLEDFLGLLFTLLLQEENEI
jgi:hypothetical protein